VVAGGGGVNRGRGLHRFPAGNLERSLREERRLQIEDARAFAELIGDTEERDGKTYRVLRLADAYGDYEERREPEIRFHRHSAQIVADLTRGPSPSTGGPAP
jgi:hypothetical protein